MGIKRFSKKKVKKKKTKESVSAPVPELAPVFEVTMPAPDMTGIVDVIRQVVDRPSVAPEIEVKVEAPNVTVNTPKPECKLKKWDIEFRRNNQGMTGATLTELPYDMD